MFYVFRREHETQRKPAQKQNGRRTEKNGKGEEGGCEEGMEREEGGGGVRKSKYTLTEDLELVDGGSRFPCPDRWGWVVA